MAANLPTLVDTSCTEVTYACLIGSATNCDVSDSNTLSRISAYISATDPVSRDMEAILLPRSSALSAHCRRSQVTNVEVAVHGKGFITVDATNVNCRIGGPSGSVVSASLIDSET